VLTHTEPLLNRVSWGFGSQVVLSRNPRAATRLSGPLSISQSPGCLGRNSPMASLNFGSPYALATSFTEETSACTYIHSSTAEDDLIPCHFQLHPSKYNGLTGVSPGTLVSLPLPPDFGNEVLSDGFSLKLPFLSRCCCVFVEFPSSQISHVRLDALEASWPLRVR